MPMIVWVHGWSFVAQKIGFFWTKQMSNNFPLCNLAPKSSIFGSRLVFYHFLWQNVIGPKLCNFYLDCNQDQSYVISTNCDILDIMNIQCNSIIQFYTFSFFFLLFKKLVATPQLINPKRFQVSSFESFLAWVSHIMQQDNI